MVGVNEDNFVVLVDTILVNPVRVQDTQVTASLADTLLRYTSQTSLGLEVVDTLADGLAVGGAYIKLNLQCSSTDADLHTLRDVLLAVSAADTDAVDHVSLLGLIAKTASLVGAGRASCSVDNIQLTVFPATDAEEETEDVRLLLFVQLPDVFVGTHLD